MHVLRPALLTLALAALSASAVAQQQTVYEWKDAKGVTHYTDTPPPDSQYKQRNLYHPDPEATPTASKGPSENPACTTARNNLALLNSKQNIQIDSNGDGKPDKALDEQGRANQLALAQATLNASCNAAPVSASGG